MFPVFLRVWFAIIVCVASNRAQVFEVNQFVKERNVDNHSYYLRREGVCNNDDPYILETEILPFNRRFFPTIANGFIGHELFSDVIFLNGLFNGKLGNSHKAEVPITTPKPLIDIFAQECFTLDMRKNIFYRRSVTNLASFGHAFYTHSLYSRLFINEISSISNAGSDIHELKLNFSEFQLEPHDVTIVNTSSLTYNSSLCNKTECSFLHSAIIKYGQTNEAETNFSSTQKVVVISSVIPSSLTFDETPKKVSKYIFFISLGFSFEEANMFYELGLKSVQAGTLMSEHIYNWNKTWISNTVSVSDSLEMNRSIKSALYYLLSSFPPLNMDTGFPFHFYGVGPGGLAHGGAEKDYQGHVFWDQDFWMVPGLLPFFPEVAKFVIQYRIKNLPGALSKAKDLHWKGAAYPWETGYTGVDVCPAMPYISQEIHITADIIHLLKQYIYITGNWKIFSDLYVTAGCNIDNFNTMSRNIYSCNPIEIKSPNECLKVSAWDMLRETSLFWLSKTHWNNTLQKFVINQVMGPDEYNYPVNNSVFTNIIASQSLKFAADVAEKLEICNNLSSVWKNVSNNILVLLNKSIPYHPEYEGFDFTTDVVKQADTIMLGFPLTENITNEVQQNDLTIYENVTTTRGPAMTWGMFAINWLSLSKENKASPMFLRQIRNIQKPFNIWSETEDRGGAVNFLTGMGGFMQSILYGYFGLRIYENNIELDPKLLPISNHEFASNMTLSGLRYREVTMNILVSSNLKITYVDYFGQELATRPCIEIQSVASHKTLLCTPGESATVAKSKVGIFLIGYGWAKTDPGQRETF